MKPVSSRAILRATMHSEHLVRQPFRRILGRCLRNRCPVCGEDRPFQGLWRMRHHCGDCGYVYERESGYWLGAVIVNYVVTAGILVTAFLSAAALWGLGGWDQLPWLLAFAVLFPVLFFRWSRLLWMGLDVFCSVPESRDFLPEPGGPPRPP